MHISDPLVLQTHLSIITLGTMKGLDENKLDASPLPDATYPIQRQPSTKVDATQAAS